MPGWLPFLIAALGTGPDTIVVDPRGPVRSVGEAVAAVAAHGTVVVRAGVYREPTVIVRHPVTIRGEPGAILDGRGMQELIVVVADSVSITGLVFRATGTSHVEDRAAVRVQGALHCSVSGNTFTDTFFAILLQQAEGCVIAHNRLAGAPGTVSRTGNGIHLWQSRDIVVRDNIITGHRDGIYFEFATGSVALRNTVRESLRYGLHFMFSDSCRYETNVFERNAAGVAVMYARHVDITGNVFRSHHGSAAYGLLLKEIRDSRIVDNVVEDNTVGMYLEGSNRNVVRGNRLTGNGWALRLLADAQENVIEGNSFRGNLFDVATNARQATSVVLGNYWDRYRGYDLDRDGRGDVPHAPVRLFALVLERAPAALLLVRSPVADALDLAERISPLLTPAALHDPAPLMRPPSGHHP